MVERERESGSERAISRDGIVSNEANVEIVRCFGGRICSIFFVLMETRSWLGRSNSVVRTLSTGLDWVLVSIVLVDRQWAWVDHGLVFVFVFVFVSEVGAARLCM